jgi:protein-disulfide isomerase
MSHKTEKPTKKQRQELRRQEKLKEEQLAKQQTKLKRRIVLWSSAVLGLVVLVLGLIKITGPAPSEMTRLVDHNSVADWSRGNRSAQIILIEYSDFQCPSCVRYHRITKRLIDEEGENFKFTFRHYPLKKHANAKLAAISSEAAGRQGKFWEMQDLLFKRQKEWAKRKKKEAEMLFVQYADALNLNMGQFRRDLRSQSLKNKVSNDYQIGWVSGVISTPTFFLNGQKITKMPRNYDAFKELLLQNKSDPA